MLPPAEPEMSPLVFTGILFLVPISWGLILHLLGRLGGWSRLAEDYRSDYEMPAARFRMRTALLRGWTHYGNCVTFGVDRRGLHFASFGSLLAHPRLFIPWSDISVTLKKSWGIRSAELRFRRAPEIPVLISARLVAKISAAAGASWPVTLHSEALTARSVT